MSGSREQGLVPIALRAGDPTTEIFLIDRNLQVLQRGVGILAAEVPIGLYEVKLRNGTNSYDEVIAVRGKFEKTYPPLEFASPVPLENTQKTHEFHVANAQAHSRVNHVTLGKNSSIYFFARDWTSKTPPPGGQSLPASVHHPARGLSLRNASGEELVNLEQGSVLGPDKWEPWAACNVAVDPGVYILRLEAPDETVWERTLVASPEWQSQCFLLQRFFGGEKAADIADATILMRRPHDGFDADSRQTRLTELARLGLVQQRPVLSPEMEELLRGKLENPMLGIFAAHLLLQQEESNRGQYDRAFFDHLVVTLRSLLKSPHPDVEALAWKAGRGERTFQFALPPMLRRSWLLITSASARWPDAIPKDSVSARVCDGILAEDPWLVWAAEQPGQNDALVEAIALYIGSAVPQPQSRFESASGAGDDFSIEVLSAQRSLAPPAPEPEAEIQRLTERLGIPRSLVEEYLPAALRRAGELKHEHERRPRRPPAPPAR